MSLGRLLSLPRRFDEWGLALGDWPGETWVTRINAAQILLWTAIGIPLMTRTGHFFYDQAYFYEMTIRAAEAWRVPAYGPFISGHFYPAPLTPGGLMFTVLSLPFLLFRDPRWGVAWIQVLVGLGYWALDRGLRNFSTPNTLRLTAVTLSLWALQHARLTRTFWNGDLFLFAAPVLLYLASRLAKDERPRFGFAVAFGFVAGICIQIHISGAMAVMICLALILYRNPRLPGLRALAGVAAFALCYASFVYVDHRAGWPDWHLLHAAVPTGAPSPDRVPSVHRALWAPIFYASHAGQPDDFLPPFKDWVGWLIGLSAAGAILTTLLGILARFPMKLACVLAFLGLPIFFYLNGRGFFDHYVASLFPWMQLWAAAGLAVLISRVGWMRSVGLGYGGFFVLAALAVLLTEFHRPVLIPNNPAAAKTVDAQLTRAQRLVDYGRPIPSHPWDWDGFVSSVLAKRVLNRDLRFAVYGHTCTIDLLLSGISDPLPNTVGHKVLIPLAENSVFVCD